MKHRYFSIFGGQSFLLEQWVIILCKLVVLVVIFGMTDRFGWNGELIYFFLIALLVALIGDAVHKEIDSKKGVYCALCESDYTDSTKKGGMIYHWMGICPECIPGLKYRLDHYGKEIGDCPPDMAFADYIRKVRKSASKSE